MRRFYWNLRMLLLVVAVAGSSGCCGRNLCRLPRGCSWGLDDCQLVDRVKQICRTGELQPRDCGQRVGQCEIAWEDTYGAHGKFSCQGEACPLGMSDSLPYVEEFLPPRLCKVEPGPPPVKYQPPMPPRFLQVPTRAVFSPEYPPAPMSIQNAVEVQYGPQLVLPALE